MITAIQRDSFQEKGLLCLENFLPPRRVEAARRAMLGRLAKTGLWKGDGWCLDGLHTSDWLTNSPRFARCLKRTAEIDDLFTNEVTSVGEELLRGCVPDPVTIHSMTASPQILLTLPSATEWTLPSGNWHVDVPRDPGNAPPGVQVFTFLDHVAPGGGGTLVVAGSHRLLNTGERIRSKDVRKRLQQEPYFRELTSSDGEDRGHFLGREVLVDAVPVQVVELHGAPGDVVFTDLRLLHTIAPNASQSPRIMATQRYLV